MLIYNRLLTVGALATTIFGTFVSANAQTYSWNHVSILGGGFIDGIIFNQSQANLVYVRTDVGGAYRLNPSNNTWISLTDWIGWSDWDLTGVASLATDPVNPNIVYMACGSYTNVVNWDPNNGAILRSADQGTTWTRSTLPFKVGGNMPGRGMCERLVIDPNNDSILFFGAPSGKGLWKSTDSGTTWSQVTSFPNGGNYVQDPTNPYTSDTPGVTWVLFDKRSGTPGNATQTIYAGVADLQNSLYVSNDGGNSWSRVANQPVNFMAHHAELDTVNGYLYLTYNNNAGPYDGTLGDVWRYTTATGAWTLISPVASTAPNGADYFGYGAVTIDRQHPSTIMVSALNSWWPDTIIWRSTNSGTTWSQIWNWTTYPNMSFRYILDISACPWLKLPPAPTSGHGRPGPTVDPKLGWMVESLQIDPFNSNRMFYGTGQTLYGTTNLTVWDQSSTSQITLSCAAQGIEETSVNDLISPPSGPPLLSALGDIGGFAHTAVNMVPSTCYTPISGTNTSIDYAELAPATIVRAGNGQTSNGEMSAATSTNSGSTWTAVTSQPSGLTGGGTIAVSANGATMVWSPAGVGVYSAKVSGRQTWAACSGVPAGALVRSDRVNSSKFYAFSNGTFYLSTNGGASFTTEATGLPSSAYFKAVPGHEGDIWLAGDSSTKGLWHSINSGASFTRLSNVDIADNIGFGAPQTGQTYVALYSSAQVGGARGIFRSTDGGNTWVQINDTQHQYAFTGAAITGDPRIYGRVYVSTNGRGIVYGDLVTGPR